eukprot:TRINITY_DN9097_c3_g1_i1.p1 TRINITY_DN9097_c3_g1~~TRINITY_DN9097_c3_g1_i1.p1  ORF type:complete len:1288 (+),score=511.53 TRINITY_DN9097_c3_g1_i1:304-3864(+)
MGGLDGTGRREHELAARVRLLEREEADLRAEIAHERGCFGVFCRHAHPARATLQFNQEQALSQSLLSAARQRSRQGSRAGGSRTPADDDPAPPPPPPDVDECSHIDHTTSDEPSIRRLTPLPNAVIPAFAPPPSVGTTLRTPLPQPGQPAASKKDVEVCMQLMARHDDDAGVAFVSVGVLGAFVRDKATRELIAAAGAVQVLLRCIVLHRCKPALLLILLQSMEQMLSSSSTHLYFVRSDALPILLDVLDAYSDHLPVSYATVSCLHSLFAHTQSLPAIAQFVNSPKGLALVMELTWTFFVSAAFVTKGVALLTYLSQHSFTHQILLHGFDQAIPRTLCSLSKAMHPDNWRIRHHMCKLLCNVTSHKHQQRKGPALDRVTDQNWPACLLDVVLEGCTQARAADTKPQTAQMIMKTVEYAVEALGQIVWNAHDKTARQLTHAAPQVVKLASGFNSKAIHAKTREILARLAATEPYVTHTALQLCLHPLLYADFRPPSTYGLKERVGLTEDGIHASFAAIHEESGEGLLVRCTFVEDPPELAALVARRRPHNARAAAAHDEEVDDARRQHYLQHPQARQFTEELLKRCAVYHPNLVNCVSWSAQVCVPVGTDYAGGVPRDAPPAHGASPQPTTVFYVAFKLAAGSVSLAEYLVAMAAALQLAEQRRRRLDSTVLRGGAAVGDAAPPELIDGPPPTPDRRKTSLAVMYDNAYMKEDLNVLADVVAMYEADPAAVDEFPTPKGSQGGLPEDPPGPARPTSALHLLLSDDEGDLDALHTLIYAAEAPEDDDGYAVLYPGPGDGVDVDDDDDDMVLPHGVPHGAATSPTMADEEEDQDAAAATPEDGAARAARSESVVRFTVEDGATHEDVVVSPEPAAAVVGPDVEGEDALPEAGAGFRDPAGGAAPSGLTYRMFFDVAADIAKGLQFLQLAGFPATPVALDGVYRDDDEGEWKVLWDLPAAGGAAEEVGGAHDVKDVFDTAARPETAQTSDTSVDPADPEYNVLDGVAPELEDAAEEHGEFQAGWVSGVKSVGYIMTDMLFYSSPSARYLFLKVGLAPGQVPVLLLNALMAPCMGVRSFTNFHIAGVGGPGGVDPYKPALITPDALAKLVLDLRLLLTFRAEYTPGADGADGDEVAPFCRWLAAHAEAHPQRVFHTLPVREPDAMGELLTLWDATDVDRIPALDDVIPPL